MLQKILLHAGTPKTGTTSLQVHLHANRESLLACGTLYPVVISGRGNPGVPAVPKHQWLINSLLSGTASDLINRVESILVKEHGDCERLVLSTEGLFNHWADITPAGLEALRTLAAIYQVELCVWFREPTAYVRSYYCQILKNPPGRHHLYGRDISVDALLDDPWFQRQLEYDRYIDEVSAVLGIGSVQPFAYTGETVHAFCEFYDLPLPCGPITRENIGLRSFGVDALRALNRHCGDAAARSRAVAEIGRLDRSLESPVFALTVQERDRINAMSARGVAALSDRYGITLAPA